MATAASPPLPRRPAPRTREPELGTPSDTSTPMGLAPSAARSESAAAVDRHPISCHESQSVRKWTPSRLESMLTASVVRPTRMSAQSSPRSRARDPRRAKMRRRRSNSPPPPPPRPPPPPPPPPAAPRAPHHPPHAPATPPPFPPPSRPTPTPAPPPPPRP